MSEPDCNISLKKRRKSREWGHFVYRLALFPDKNRVDANPLPHRINSSHIC